MPSADGAKKNRARIGQYPEPGGLFHPAKPLRKETVGWHWIGSSVRPSAELSRTSSYFLTPVVRRPQVREDGGCARGTANTATTTSASSECRSRPLSPGQESDS